MKRPVSTLPPPEALLDGYDPEQENGLPDRSDAWCSALGWQDAIGEEAWLDAERENMTKLTKPMVRETDAYERTSQEPSPQAGIGSSFSCSRSER